MTTLLWFQNWNKFNDNFNYSSALAKSETMTVINNPRSSDLQNMKNIVLKSASFWIFEYISTLDFVLKFL